MTQSLKNSTFHILEPRIILFFVALFNFVWFFSQSRTVKEFGSTAISFCAACAWHWNWSLSNPPSLSLFATSLFLFGRWQGYLVASIISGYQIIEGIIWVSRISGFFNGLQQRYEIIYERIFSDDPIYDSVWTFLDVQYLFAVIIFFTAIIYLILQIIKSRKATENVFS